MDTPTGAVNAADFRRWNRQLREGDGLEYVDQLKLNNLTCVLRDKYLELSASYADVCVRLDLIHGPLNELANLRGTFLRGGVVSLADVFRVVGGLVEDFDELNRGK